MKQAVQVVRKTKCGIERAAEILNKTQAATRKDVERGRIPYRRLGSRIFFFEEELYAYLDAVPGVTLEQILAR